MKTKIFILEDNIICNALYKKFFEKKGFDVESFTTLRTISKRLERVIPDVLIADYELPKGNCLSILVKYKHKISLMIGLTGHFDNDKIRKELYVAGCVDVKPKDSFRMVYNTIQHLTKNKRGRDTVWL